MQIVAIKYIYFEGAIYLIISDYKFIIQNFKLYYYVIKINNKYKTIFFTLIKSNKKFKHKKIYNYII